MPGRCLVLEPRELTLLTGATGYVGGRLLEQLESAAIPVRCMVRRPENLASRVADTTEVVKGDVFDRDSLARAMTGVSTAYYLVHSMSDEGNFEVLERKAARLFGEIARAAGVQRIIYLGGLGSGDELSSHLETRQEVGRLLRESGVPTLELRASIVHRLGQSLLRDDPRTGGAVAGHDHSAAGCRVLAQPIAIEDVVAYLVEALDLPDDRWQSYSKSAVRIVVTYADIMREYARQRGLRRLMIPVPVLTPRLSSLWLGMSRPFTRGSVESSSRGSGTRPSCQDEAMNAFDVHPVNLSEAIARALANEDQTSPYPVVRRDLRGRLKSWGGTKVFGSRGRRIAHGKTLRCKPRAPPSSPCVRSVARRLVLRELDVATARFPRPARRRRRDASWSTRSGATSNSGMRSTSGASKLSSRTA